MVVAMALEVKPIISGKRAFHLSSSIRHAVEWLKRLAAGRTVEKVGVPTSVPVRMAHDLLLAGHRYLDVRTPEEFSAGHAVGAVNVPYMLKLVDGMAKNSTFLEEVSNHFGKDVEIIVGCKSGKRSLMAATDLFAVLRLHLHH
ncbi:hypothetical protein Sjap_022264 [Stephania japonica]|uniref:Rhodanese domain-containing protein n=1 Tax=Stephania japonica TaxID=461633 RepID=A0AAP0ETX9_9MAGN